jgi:hypothetical protein
MNPLTWLKLVPVAIEGISTAVGAFTGKHDGYETQQRIDRIRARGAANRAKRMNVDPQADIDTKRAKPPMEP